jgi:very-short-patch-repair endonuclease
LVIELDGDIHKKQKDYDQMRTETLEFKNVMVVRFTNNMIIKDLDQTLNQFQSIIAQRRNNYKNVT